MSKNARFMDTITMIPITYGYARVSKADDNSKNLETQLRELDAHGIRRDLVFTDEASGRTMNRPGWRDLMSRIQPGDTIVVAFLDRFSRNFEEGVAIQADLTRRDIAIVAIREQIDTREGSRRRQLLPAGDAGPGRLPGGVGQRAHPHGAGSGPCQRQAHRSPSGAQSGTGGAVPAHGGGRGGPAADRPGPEMLTGDCKRRRYPFHGAFPYHDNRYLATI